MKAPEKSLICYTPRRSLGFSNKEACLRSCSSLQNKKILKVYRRLRFKPRLHSKRRKGTENTLSSKEIVPRDSLLRYSATENQYVSQGRTASCLSPVKEKRTDDEARNREKIKRRRQRKIKSIEKDEVCRLQRRARYLLIKIKLEQNLIDAYCGDGWKGQSREKIKPEKELQRAQNQIVRCKLGIRESIRQLQLLSSEGSIETSMIYPDWFLSHEHVFCAKCKGHEAFPGNGIVLCAGTCNCRFHQKCLEPPLGKVPPGDVRWLCRFCECKMGILEAINAHLGTCFGLNSRWEDIFKEATTISITGKNLDPAEDWPSEDSEDEDYNPKINESSDRTSSEECLLGKLSSTPVPVLSDEVQSYSNESQNFGHVASSYCIKSKSKNKNQLSGTVSSDGSVEDSDDNALCHQRRRKFVDYTKLHDELFGKFPAENEQQSEDEDWDPLKRKRRVETDTGATMSDFSGLAQKAEKNSSDRKRSRIPLNIVEKLRQVFADDELPSRGIRENLATELGLGKEKITKWFRNARYTALRIRKAGENSQHCNNCVISRSNQSELSPGEVDDYYMLPLSSITSLRKHSGRKNATSMVKLLKEQKKLTSTLPTSITQVSRTIKKNPVTSSSNCQARLRFKNEVYYKRRASDIKSKFSSKEAIGGAQSCLLIDDEARNGELCLAELERLCNLENRLKALKLALSMYEDNYAPSSTQPCGPFIMYVPYAELKEKAY